MAKRKQGEPIRNDASAVMNALYGDSPGWAEDVARYVVAYGIAEEVDALRERHGLTQAALAALIGSSQSAIRSCLLYTSPSPRD